MISSGLLTHSLQNKIVHVISLWEWEHFVSQCHSLGTFQLGPFCDSMWCFVPTKDCLRTCIVTVCERRQNKDERVREFCYERWACRCALLQSDRIRRSPLVNVQIEKSLLTTKTTYHTNYLDNSLLFSASPCMCSELTWKPATVKRNRQNDWLIYTFMHNK